MGRGKTYICKHCNKKVDLFLGLGFSFPNVYQEKVEEICDGKHGEEWKRLYQSEEFAAIDAERYLYYCKRCGYWEIASCMDLYVPKDSDRIRNKQYGIKTVEEWGKIPYVFRRDLRTNYNLLKEYNHGCPNCDETMEYEDSEDVIAVQDLKCNECGNIMEENGMFLWD